MFNSLNKQYILNNFISYLAFISLILLSLEIVAQPSANPEEKIIFYEKKSIENPWLGHWQAAGTLFEIELKSSNGIFSIEEINSMGFDWVSSDLAIEGENLKVTIEYGGAKGLIVSNLSGNKQQFAFAHVATCEPAYLVICALSKNREIKFQRLEKDVLKNIVN